MKLLSINRGKGEGNVVASHEDYSAQKQKKNPVTYKSVGEPRGHCVNCP